MGMSKVGQYYEELQHIEREKTSNHGISLKARCTDILVDNGFDKERASELADSIIVTYGRDAVSECTNMLP